MDPPPEYLASRTALFDKLKAEYDAEVASRPVQTIAVTLPDGKVVEAESWRTTPYEVVRGIRLAFKQSKYLALLTKIMHVILILDKPNFSVFQSTAGLFAHFNQ